MKSLSRCLGMLALAASFVAAQSTRTVYFSTRFTETPTSGRAGDNLSSTAPCGGPNTPGPFGSFAIESALANSPGVIYVDPGVLNSTVPFSGGGGIPATATTDYVELVNFPQFNLIIGDLDADGIPDESDNFRGVDALWIPTPAVGRPNNIHEMFVSSFQDSVGATGFLGVNITEADMVLLPRAPNVYPAPSVASPPVFFIRQPDFEAFFGLAAPNNGIDLDAFAVDQATGDLYVSFDTSITGAQVRLTAAGTAQSTTITRGDIIRIPGTAYTPSGPYGRVTAPIAGQAQLVMTQAQVAAMVTLANGPGGGSPSVNPVNVFSLDLDPTGGTYLNPTSGFTIANLLFSVESSGGSTTGPQYVAASAIYSTLGGGMFAVINGITMSNPNALGMRNTSWNTGFWAGAIDALDVITHSPTLNPFADRPLHLDSFPTNGILGMNGASYTGNLTGYISNASPGAVLAIFGMVYIVPNGSFVPRYDVSPFVGGYSDLYVDFFGLANQNCILSPPQPPFDIACQVPAAQSLLNNGNNPVLVWTDPVNGTQNGDCCFTLNLTAVVPINTPPYVPPPLIVFQALDLSSLRLSSPLSFLLN